MFMLCKVRRTIDRLRTPFVQRLIVLVVSMLLAASLLSPASIFALPQRWREVVSQGAPLVETSSLQKLQVPGEIPVHVPTKGQVELKGGKDD